MNNIGDKVKIINVQDLTEKDMQILFKNGFICTIAEVDTFPLNEGSIDIIYTVELSDVPFITPDFQIITK